jgi:hypothetical protein
VATAFVPLFRFFHVDDVPEIRRRMLGNPWQPPRWSSIGSRAMVPPLQPGVDGMLESLSSAEIEELLETEVVVRLGCHAAGRTDVVPAIYGIHLLEKTGRLQRR